MLRRVFILLAAAATLSLAAKPVDLLIQGAVDTELQPLLTALQNKKEVQINSWTFWTGTIAGKNVVISRTEMGPINAVAATVLGIQRFHPKAIINQGTAGAHNSELNLYDIVVSEKTTDYSGYKSVHGDPGTGVQLSRWSPMAHRLRIDGKESTPFQSFTADATLMNAALKVANPRGKVVKGMVGSAFQFNRELDFIEWMHKNFGTDSEDMESAYVAGVAKGMNVPFLAIRIISDSEYKHPTFEKIAGQYCAEFVVEFVKSLPKR